MLRSVASSKEGWAQRARILTFWLLALLAAAFIGVLLEAKPAHAAQFRVNYTIEDVGDYAPGDGQCSIEAVPAGTRGNCTLRAAIEEANANDASDTITFSSGLSGTITLTLGQLAITDDNPDTTATDLTIEGPEGSGLSVSADNASRVFYIGAGTEATIQKLTITGGRAEGESGGGIHNDGRLVLYNSTVSGNSANKGGGIYQDGTESFLWLNNSTVSANDSVFNGGGIHNAGGNHVSLLNSTVTNNSAGGSVVGFVGGGIYSQDNATSALINTIVSDNSASSSPDLNGRFLSGGFNLIGNVSGASSDWRGSDLLNRDPLLGPLRDNGGPTQTHALKPKSPAINAIPTDANCGTNDPNQPWLNTATDQRGVKRPQGGECEIGSFEDKSPKVKKVVPQEGATGIAPGTNVVASFSESMRKASISATTFKLFRAGTSTAIGAKVSYDATTKKATLNPDANLQRGARYKAVVSTGAKDLAGNRLDQNPSVAGNQSKVWFFRVRN